MVELDGQKCKIADFGEAHLFENNSTPINNNLETEDNSASLPYGTLKSTAGTYQFFAPEMLTG